jgi:hypothetical protein
MISEWLELDADDDWVRHDAEIVGPSSRIGIRKTNTDGV